MGFNDLIQSAVNLGSTVKFTVQIDDNESEELNCIQLGTYLVANVRDIEIVKIVMKD